MNLKELRARKGASQQDVADYLEVSRQAYGHYETGTRAPDYETLLKLAEYFQVTVDYLLRGENINLIEQKNTPVEISDRDIMFALFDGDTDDITDEMYEDVKAYARFIAEKKRKQCHDR